ncbi:MAG: hypothetical protein WAO58_03030 [Fimbriimonadaceae bacterium]
MSCQCKFDKSAKRSRLPWLVLTAAAVGVSTWLIVNRSKGPHAEANPDNLLDLCERAASQLDDRLNSGHAAFG